MQPDVLDHCCFKLRILLNQMAKFTTPGCKDTGNRKFEYLLIISANFSYYLKRNIQIFPLKNKLRSIPLRFSKNKNICLNSALGGDEFIDMLSAVKPIAPKLKE